MAKVNVNRTLTTQESSASCDSWNSGAEISTATPLTHRFHKPTQQFSAHLYLCIASVVSRGRKTSEVNINVFNIKVGQCVHTLVQVKST